MCQKIQTKNSLFKKLSCHPFWKILTLPFDLHFHNQNSNINITCNNLFLGLNNILDQHAPLRFASRKETRSFHPQTLVDQWFANIYL